MATLTVQSHGLIGAGLTTQPADPAGDVVANRPGLVLLLRNTHATLNRTVRVVASRADDRGAFHDLLVEVPPTPAGSLPYRLDVGTDLVRFPVVVLEYPTTADSDDLEVGAAHVRGIERLGESPAMPALGASPGTAPAVEIGEAPVLAPFLADGMLAANGHDDTVVFFSSAEPDDRTLFVESPFPTVQGFRVHEAITIPAGVSEMTARFSRRWFGTTLRMQLDTPGAISIGVGRVPLI